MKTITLTAILAVASACTATAAVTIDFNSAASYTNNFYTANNPSYIKPFTYDTVLRAPWEATVLPRMAVHSPGGSSAPTRFDNDLSYYNETVSITFQALGLTATPTVGLLTRIQTSGYGILGYVSLNPNSVRFSFSSVNTADGVLGTSFGTSVAITPTRNLTTNSNLTLKMEASGSQFRLTLLDTQGEIATSGWQSLTGILLTNYDKQGGVGMRATPYNSVTISQFSITPGAIPEPAQTVAIIGLSMVLMGWLLKLKRARV